MTWEHGRLEVDRLIEGTELQRVTADLKAARRLLDDAFLHVQSAHAIKNTDPNGAFVMTYDAVRKACSALLEAQGLRATSRGGHLAIRDAVLAQFGDLSGGETLRPYDRLRRRRNAIEYPDNEVSADIEEVDEALERAAAVLDFTDRLVDHLPPY